MKSIVIEQPNQLSISERPMPSPQSGEVCVKVSKASICGSDVGIWHGLNPFAKYPRVIGHEFYGTIENVGENVDPARIGQRVVVDPVVACGHCYPCSVGKPNVCETLQVIGVHRDGGFSEFACVPAKNAYVLPDAIADEYASLVEPFTIAANICAYIKPTEKDIALVYGAGPMGLTAIQALKYVYHVKEVIVAERVPERLERALANGADRVIDNSQADTKTLLGDTKPTIIIDGACHPAIFTEAAEVASPAGRIGLLGFSTTPSSITQKALTSKELSVFTSRLNSLRFNTVIDWFTQGIVEPEKIITHHYPLSEIETAMTLFETDQKSCCKIIIDINK